MDLNEVKAELRCLLDGKETALQEYQDEEGEVNEEDFPYYDEVRADWNESIAEYAEHLLEALEGK